MEKALELAFIDLSIPLWQIIVYLGLLSFFMLTWRMKPFFATTILFILYWGYLLRPHFLAAADSGFVAIAAIALFGLLLAGLLFYTLFLDIGAEPGANFPGREMAHLGKSLLKRMDKMEKSLLNEAQAQVKDQGSKLEAIQQELDAKLLIFRAQIEEESAARRELEIREMQGKLGDRIRELEEQISAKEELLAARGREKEEMEAGSRARLDSLEARLRESESRLREREEAVEAQKAESEEAEKRIASLEAELSQKTEALNGNRVSFTEVEENLKRKIQELERQLEEKEGLLQASSAKDPSFEPFLTETPPGGNIREKIEAVLEPEMEKLWADLAERGMLSEEKKKEAEIIQKR